MSKNGRTYKNSMLKRRIFAFTLDLFLVTMINKVIINSYVLYLQTVFYHFSPGKQAELVASLESVFLSVFALLFLCYHSLSLSLGNGQTPGKILFAIRIVDKKSESQLKLWQVLGRTFLYSASCLFFFLPLALSFVTPRGNGIHDLFSSSKCVHIKRGERAHVYTEKTPTEVGVDRDYQQAA